MAALEYRVLSELLRSGKFDTARSMGLTDRDFKSLEARTIFKFIESHWNNDRTKGTMPLLDKVQSRFPGFELTSEDPQVSSTERLPTLVYELRKVSLQQEIRSLCNGISELVDDDPVQALAHLKGNLPNIIFDWEPSKGANIQDVVDSTLQSYALAKQGQLMGVPWPWPCLTQDTMGKKGGDLYVFYGRMKSMKTWVMLKCACEDYQVHDQRVMIWSKEMSEDKLKLRIASILAKADYQLLKAGKLPGKIADRVFSDLNTVRDLGVNIKTGNGASKKDIMILSGRTAPKDIATLATYVRDYKPDVVYIDSFYHLEPNKGGDKVQLPTKLTYLSENLKELALDFNIPVVATAQANRLGEKTLGNTLADVAGTDSLGREADLIMRIIKRKGKPLREDYEVEMEKEKLAAGKPIRRRSLRLTPEEPEPNQEGKEEDEIIRVGAELAIILGGNREGTLEAFTIHAIPGYNFSVIQQSFDSGTIHDWVAQDEELVRKEVDHKLKRQPSTQFRGSDFRS